MVKRILVLKVVFLLALIIVVARAAQLQLVMGDYYYQLSEGNRISLRPINAPRGKIYDKNGKILVSNKLAYDLYLLPNEVPPDISVKEILHRLSKYTNLPISQLEKNYQEHEGDSSPSPIILKRNITPETMVIIQENAESLPGIFIKESAIRYYVYGDLAPHVVGYVGEISTEELRNLTSQGYDYRGGDIVGKAGLERQYEIYLKGTDGIEQIEVNSLREKVRTLGIKPPRPGNNLILNLDYELQKETERLLEEHFYKLREEFLDDPEMYSPTGAAAIVMDPDTGEILAMASIPDYNLNEFAEGLSLKEYKELLNDPLKPLLNRTIMAAVPPGSIFKLVTGTAAIEELGIRADTKFVDENGMFFVPNWSRPYKNWHPGGEGELSFTRAIARSNNVVFYELGYRLYKKYRGKKLKWYAHQYGLGSPTGIDLPGEKEGLVPDEKWKRKVFNEGWYPGDSVNLSIGQGGLLTTPLQLAVMVSSIANGGIIYEPHLVDKVISPDGEVVLDVKPRIKKRLPFRRQTLNILEKGMVEVTSTSYGTARSVFADFPIKVAGKTGTAQTGTSRPNHGWFAGYAPVEDPEITVLVFLENGNSSSYTLPIVAGILRTYFGIEEPVEEEQNNEGSSSSLDENVQEVEDKTGDKKDKEQEIEKEREIQDDDKKLLEYLEEVFSKE